MKQHSYFLKLFITIIFFIGCGEISQNQDLNDEVIIETPKTLSEDNNRSYLSEFKSRGYSNLVDDLFDEAKEKDKSLSALIKSTEKASEQKNKLISLFNDYNSKNIKYFNDANQYISQIQDSIKRQKTKRAFKTLQANYNAENKIIQQAISTLESKEIELRDQEIIMKLMVSSKMIKSYQNNEKPDIKKFKDAIKDYRELIQKTDEYIK